MLKIHLYVLISLYLLIFKKCYNTKNIKLASIDKKHLYLHDIQSNIKNLKNYSERQSEIIKLRNEWIEKESLILEASKNINFKNLELDKRLQEYKYSLIIHHYLQQEIKKRLNYDILDSEIENYYRSNLKNFELKENIVRCFYIIVPKNAPNIKGFEKQFINYNINDNILHLRDYCEKHAIQYSINPHIWHKFESVILSSPLEKTRDKIRLIKLIKNTPLYKVRGLKNKNLFYFKIIDYKISSQTSPLEFVRKQIKTTIIYSRKIRLRKKIIKDLIDRNKKNKNIKTYNLDFSKVNY